VRICFQDFALDTDRHELSRDSKPLPLRLKALELLQILIENRPKAMSHAELYDRLWPDTLVQKTSLHKVMYQLREALGDDEHAIIRTVYGFGFSFAAAAYEEQPNIVLTRWQVVIGDREFDLREGENIVGRERGAAIRLDAASISRRHARIIITGDQATLEDFGSKNGTLLRGKRIRVARLNDGDSILFGTIAAAIRVIRAAASTETVR
jgi:DNA-binding winged helix-turn-helix (wHTH) protein